jgi:hypothetical protein
MYDPASIAGITTPAIGAAGAGGLLDETDTPRFEGELSYSTAFNGGNFKAWVDGLWQDIDSTCNGASGMVFGATAVQCGNITAQAWGAGAKIGWQGFEFVGYYHDNEGLGLTAQFNSAAVFVDAGGNLRERGGDGYYVQGTYTFAGKTKVGVSYGEGNLEDAGTGTAPYVSSNDVERALWTVGVYHDVSSWLRLIAEYNHGELDTGAGNNPEADTFSVGGFLFW